MSNRGDPTPHRLEKLKAALRGGATASAASAAGGYARTYIYKLAQTDPEIAAILEDRRRRGLARGGPKRIEAPERPARAPRTGHQAVASEAIERLRKIIADDKAPKGPQVSACRAALTWAASEEALLYQATQAEASEAAGVGPAPGGAAEPRKRMSAEEAAKALGISIV